MRPEKKEMVEEIFKKIDKSNGVVITDYRGLKAGQINALRRQLKGSSSDYMVIKNTLLLKALEKAEITGVDQYLSGSTAVLFISGDQAETVKTLVKFSTANTMPKIKAGVMNKEILPKEKLEYLATLPSKNVMIATVISRMQSPIYGIVFVLSGVEKKLLYAINAIKEKKEKEQPKQEAATAPKDDAPAAAPAPENK